MREFSDSTHATSAEALMAAQALPQLPSLIRYVDDFADEWRIIRDPDSDIWNLQGDGAKFTFKFGTYEQHLKLLIKHWLSWGLSRSATASVKTNYYSFKQLHEKYSAPLFYKLLTHEPSQLREFWYSTLMPENDFSILRAVKSFLAFMCEMSLGKLTPGYFDFVGAFGLPRKDKYATVRTGDVFLDADEEAAIVEFLDETNALVRTSRARIDDKVLCSACILCVSYQYAMRPIQIAKVRLSDVRRYPGSLRDGPAVHITFFRAKQRMHNKHLPMLRKIKREWAFMFDELYQRRLAYPDYRVESNALPDALFGLTPQSVGVLISKTTESLTGIARPASHLRHSAAQRLVDAGASLTELAEFLGHSYSSSGLVYFEASPAQAERINKALALSPIYSNVADAARTRTIDRDKLLHLLPDHQIGAVPHGIPIAGIGACNLGQSLCSKNPVLSCYSCRRFMAVTDATVHQDVLDSLRPIVRFFYDESSGEIASPAYMQLRTTLASIQAVIGNLNRLDSDE